MTTMNFTRRIIFLLLLTSTGSSGATSSSKRECRGDIVPQASEYIFKTLALWNRESSSKTHCQLTCLRYDECVAFTFFQWSPKSRRCMALWDIPDSQNSRKMIYFKGARSFKVERTVQLVDPPVPVVGSLTSDCITNEHCRQIMGQRGVCVNYQCHCPLGTFHSITTQECVSSCKKFLDGSYSIRLGTKLETDASYYVINHLNITMAKCTSYCTNMAQCLAVNTFGDKYVSCVGLGLTGMFKGSFVSDDRGTYQQKLCY